MSSQWQVFVLDLALNLKINLSIKLTTLSKLVIISGIGSEVDTPEND